MIHLCRESEAQRLESVVSGAHWTSQRAVFRFRGAAGRGEVCLGGTPLEELREAKREIPRKQQEEAELQVREG